MSVGNREVHHGISLQWVETDVGRKQGSSSWHIATRGGNGRGRKQGSSSWHIAIIGGNRCR